MSKSLGNVIEIRDGDAKDSGAEIVAPVVRGDRLLGRPRRSTTRSWRAWSTATGRIRNTLRFLLANTADFDAAKRRRAGRRRCWRSTAGRCRAPPRCRPRCWRTTSVYEFHPVVAKLQLFCSEDLGAFYLDVLKDRLYTTAPKSWRGAARRRRCGRSRTRCCAGWRPSCSFTAEEAWQVLAPGKRLDLLRDLLDASTRPTPRCWPSWSRIRASCATRSTRRSRRCAPPAAWARRCRPRSRSTAGAADHALLAVAGRRPQVRPHHLAGDAARRATTWRWRCAPAPPSSANAAGTGATTSATTRRTRRSAAAARATCTARAKRARWPDRGQPKRRRRRAWRCGWAWRRS